LRLAFVSSLLVALVALAGSAPAADSVNYVINISVDGMGSSYLQSLLSSNQAPNFQQLISQGAYTFNARDDYDITVTLPNHTTMMTGRGIVGTTGHNWTSNSDPAANQTLASNKGSYVASVYDVVHDNGMSTALYATKTKFSLFDTSYNATNGALDVTGADNGRDKLDRYVYNSSSSSITSQFVTNMTSSPTQFNFLHFTDPDTAGHASGWGSTAYQNSLKAVDGYLGTILNFVESNATLKGKTAILITADHGGSGTDHSDATLPLDYTIPFIAYGPGVQAGTDLYALNSTTRQDPGTGRPNYSAAVQPIRNGDIANLSLDLLGLSAIPGSTINTAQNLSIQGAAPPQPQFENVTLVPKGAVWKYLHPTNGTDPGVANTFMQKSFNDSAWASGAGPLGYGEQTEHPGYVKTEIGTPASGNRYTGYFRLTFNVSDADSFTKLALDLARDDGVVVYLNGQELTRDNMPAGTVGYKTLASGAIGGATEVTYVSITDLANLLVDGENVLAVALFNSGNTSSDLSFDLSLIGTRQVPEPSTIALLVSGVLGLGLIGLRRRK
jgi:hypothetical protein